MFKWENKETAMKITAPIRIYREIFEHAQNMVIMNSLYISDNSSKYHHHEIISNE